MKWPKISIVIPSYNKVDYITGTLKSIVAQKYPNLEVLVQDGGSTDGTLEIIKEYARKYPEVIKWVSRKDKGQVDAINKGMRKAKGDVLTYINADDIYWGNALRVIGKAYLKNPDSLWFAGKGKVIDEDGKEISKWVMWYKNLLLSLNFYPLLLIVNYLMQPSVFIIKKAYNKYGPFMGTKDYVLEYDLWLRLGRVQMPLVINKNLSGFRLSRENISSVAYKKLLASDFNVLKKYVKNPILLSLHKLHNLGRVIIINNTE